jgi:hypothetical protein
MGVKEICGYAFFSGTIGQYRRRIKGRILRFAHQINMEVIFQMNKRNNHLIKHRRIAGLLALVLTAAVFLASCANGPDTTPDVSPTSPAPSQIADTSASPPDSAPDVAEAWAEAVKARDGKAQYALMTKALQAMVHDEFTGLNWVTGTSSPWVESYTVEEDESGVRVIFAYATSTGPSGSYYQDLTFETEDGALKISAISELQEESTAEFPAFPALIKLLGLTKDELLAAVPETPEPVDEGGFGFDKAGVRVWFDEETHTVVAQVLIMSDQIDIEGAKVGDPYDDFKAIFGEPVSDENGDAHFKYGEIYLSVVRDTNTGTVVGVYILAEDF